MPRLVGLVVFVLLAAGGVTAYLLVVHPKSPHHAAALPTTVLSNSTVGLVAENAQSGGRAGQLMQLLSPQGGPEFSPLDAAQVTQGTPEWTADQMAGGTYIFIFLKTGACLTAGDPAGGHALTLQRCNLGAAQRWRRTGGAVVSDGHDFYQYANLGDGECLTQQGTLPGPAFGARLTACLPSAPATQLIAFWWASV